MNLRLALLSNNHSEANSFHARADAARGPQKDPRERTRQRTSDVEARTAAILPKGVEFK